MKQEVHHVLETARNVQPISHWEEMVSTFEVEGDYRTFTRIGEIHGSFVVHGDRRLLCWYRIESEDTTGSSAYVSELVACPMSSPTHPSQVILLLILLQLQLIIIIGRDETSCATSPYTTNIFLMA